MIGLRQTTRFLNRSMQTQSRYGSMIKTSQRGFAGGAEKPPMAADNTDFDILFVGGGGAAGLLKTTQLHEDAQHLKMGIVSKDMQFCVPQAYFNVTHEHKKPLTLESAIIVNMVDSWSAVHNTTVTKLNPASNTVVLDDGKELTYKALVLAPGFDS